MSDRLDHVDPAGLTGSAAALYSKYASGQRVMPESGFTLVTEDGQLLGPPAAWMLSPDLGLGLERVGFEVRFNLSLSARFREIVILIVAAVENSPFERFAHHQAARHAGLTDDEIADLDAGSFVPVDDTEATIIKVVEALLSRGTLDEALWSQADAALGRRAIFEVVTLIGWYRMMALQLRTFALEPPA